VPGPIALSREATFVDADIGQKDVGPPATITPARVERDGGLAWSTPAAALLGAVGSGKTTLARVAMGYVGYTTAAGHVRFRDWDLAGMQMHERARLGITMAWQEPARFEGLTVACFLSLSPLPRRERESAERLSTPLENLGLRSWAMPGSLRHHLPPMRAARWSSRSSPRRAAASSASRYSSAVVGLSISGYSSVR